MFDILIDYIYKKYLNNLIILIDYNYKKYLNNLFIYLKLNINKFSMIKTIIILLLYLLNYINIQSKQMNEIKNIDTLASGCPQKFHPIPL